MNARQQRFVEEYLIDPCATRAARRAGYSKKTADRIGSRLLRNVEVSAAIATAQAERAERLQVTADVVVAELALHAFGDFRDFFDESRLLEPFELSTETAHRVCSIRITRERTYANGESKTIEQTIEIKAHDKIRSLELLGRHLGMFRDHQVHEADVSLLEVLRRIERDEDAAKAETQ